MSTKWTAGPWHWKATGEVADKWGSVYAGTECICGGMLRADARLIAAAPDLYAALADVTELAAEYATKERIALDHDTNAEYLDGLDASVAMASAALALARGEKMSVPGKITIQKRLRELRTLIDGNNDPVECRIAYAMECAIRWAIEETVGWESPMHIAVSLAQDVKRDLARRGK